MNYTPINWQNGEYGNTPLNSENLNHMDNAIKTIAEESKANTESIEYCQEDIEANAGKIEENTELISGLRTDVTELQNKISGDITPHSVNTPALTAAEGNFTNVTVSGEAVIPTIKGNNAAVSMPNGISTTDVAANKTESRTVESVFLNTTNLTATGYVEMVGPTIKRGRYDDMPCIYGEDTRKINFPNGIEVSGELNVNTFTANESVIDELRVDAIRASYNPQKRTLEIEPKISANDIDCTNIKAVGYLECGIIESAGIHSTEEIIDGHGNVLSEVAANARDNTAISLTCDINSKVTDSAESNIVGIDALGKSEQAKSIIIPTVQGQVANTSSAINQALTTSDIRCSSDVMWLAKGTVISVPSAFEIYALYASTATGNITNKIQWASTQTLDADGYWRLMVRRTNGYALAPDSFVMEIAAPTPTNPIPIVSASDVNLCGNYQIGKSWNGTSNANRGYVEANLVAGATYTISFNGNKDGITTLALFCVNDDSEATYSINYSLTDNNVKTYTFVCPANAKRARALIVSNAVVTQEMMDSKEIQIERGTSASAYVPYGCASVEAHTYNLFDETKIVRGQRLSTNEGIYGSEFYADENCFVSALIKVKSGNTYTKNTPGDAFHRVAFYDSNKVRVGRSENTSFTVPSNAQYLAFCGYLTEINSTQINEGTTATDYVPYASNSISIPFAMRGIGDIHDELIINEDRSGKYIQRIDVADLAELTWYDGTGSAYWYTKGVADKIRLSQSTTEMPNMLCTTLSANTRNATTGKGTNFVTVYANGNVVATSTDKPQGTLYFELAAPIETDLTAEQVDSILSLQTYKPTTVFETEMGGSVSYAGDVKAYVDNKFNYSYTDRIIGKWADGKDLHQVVIQTTTPSVTKSWQTISSVVNGTNCNIKKIEGMAYRQSGSMYIPINYFGSVDYFTATIVNNTGLYMQVGATDYCNLPCEIIVEYTEK